MNNLYVKRGQEKCQSWKMGWSAVGCCLLNVVQLFYSQTHSCCDYLHKTDILPWSIEGWVDPRLSLKPCCMEKKHNSFSKVGICLVEPVIVWARALELLPRDWYLGRDYSSFAKSRNLLGGCSNSLGPGPWGLWGFAI